ncbi:MAG: hypothetical protein KH135_02340 [Firmicutes bacterium]|nr:hypothetical protein [Bacillota bacterium]
MNYYNPYYQMYPYVAAAPVKKGIFSSLTGGLKGINWGNILNNTQRTLNIVNQAIPAVKQITPVMKNARTMFQVMNEFKKVDTPTTNVTANSNPTQAATTSQTEVSAISGENQKTQEINSTNIDSQKEAVSSNISTAVDNGPTFFV